MAAMGWVGLVLPGGGGDLIDLSVIFQELGRAVCPTPLFSTVVVAGLILADAGQLPDGVAEGETLIGTAVVDVATDAFEAEVSGSKARVRGVARFAYDIDGADHLLVVAGPSVVLIPAAQAGVESAALAPMSNDRLFELRLDDVQGEVIGATAALVPRAVARATAMRTAEAVGVMERAVEMASEHARSRVQFGQPLGAFQAVQHRLADMLIDLEGARLVANRAAWALVSDPDAHREVSIAKAWVADACQRVAFGAQQVHGGVGVDLDYDLQLYFRRAKALEVELGSAPEHRARLAGTIGLA
jgi:alkylation response protein AidB-like acyl-CoA dehydrogenase